MCQQAGDRGIHVDMVACTSTSDAVDRDLAGGWVCSVKYGNKVGQTRQAMNQGGKQQDRAASACSGELFFQSGMITIVGCPIVSRGSWHGVVLRPRDTTRRMCTPDASRIPFTSSVRRSMPSIWRGVTSRCILSALAELYSRLKCACTTWYIYAGACLKVYMCRRMPQGIYIYTQAHASSAPASRGTVKCELGVVRGHTSYMLSPAGQ